MQMQIRQRSATCTPDDKAVNQTWSIAVKKGERVMSAAMQALVAGTGGSTSTFQARVSAAGGGAAGGLIGATDTEQTVGAIIDGAGADLNSGRGFLVPDDGSIDILYTAGAGNTATPSARFTFGIRREFPY